MTRITDLTDLLMSMFIANGCSSKKEALDFLKTVEEISKYVSSSEWKTFSDIQIKDASRIIVDISMKNKHHGNHYMTHHELNKTSSSSFSSDLPVLRLPDYAPAPAPKPIQSHTVVIGVPRSVHGPDHVHHVGIPYNPFLTFIP